MLLIILGDGVVANVVLNKTKGQNAGWIVITAGWAFGVAVAVYAVGSFSGAHLNPAVTIGLASIGKFAWGSVPAYIAAQMLGAFLGATIVWLAYLPHWSVTESQGTKLAVFCTAPAVRNVGANLVTEIIGTFVLVLGVLAILTPKNLNPVHGWDAGFGPWLVGVLVWAIGLSLGGPRTRARRARAPSCSIIAAMSSRRRRKSSARSFPSRAGWSTTPGRFGPLSCTRRRKPWRRPG